VRRLSKYALVVHSYHYHHYYQQDFDLLSK